MLSCTAYAASAADAKFAPFTFERRDPGPKDVAIDIQYCGVCHSDLHTARGEWHGTTYPCVPGHEIVGTVREIGSEVTKFAVGDRVGVGCMVDSCRSCEACRDGLEQYCIGPATFTYNSPDKVSGGNTYGGYSQHITVDQDFVVRISHDGDLAAVAPLLCAGITTYSPLAHWKVGPGQKVGVVGLGGLGHMGVKIASAMGAEVFLITTSPGKAADAERLGAKGVIISKDEADMKAHAGSFHFILDTVSAKHDLNAYFDLLKRDGVMVQVGVPPMPLPIEVGRLIFGRKTFAGSLIGGIAETQEMLDFCAKHGITADIEMLPIEKIDDGYERMLASDVKYRFVIDIAAGLPKAA